MTDPDDKHAGIHMPVNPDHFYAKAPNPRKKTNIKNKASTMLGDPRCSEGQWISEGGETLARVSKVYPLKPSREIVHGYNSMTRDERNVVYTNALEYCGTEGINKLLVQIRKKIEERCSGLYGLRRAFKNFDRDGSGTIDPAEFVRALELMGTSATEMQTIAVFGLFDVDRGGSLEYYEFIKKVLDSNWFCDKSLSILKQNVHNTGVKKIHEHIASVMNQMLDQLESGEYREGIGTKIRESCISEEGVERLFEMFDRDCDGEINSSELIEMATALEMELSDPRLKQKIVQVSEMPMNFEMFWEWWMTSHNKIRGTHTDSEHQAALRKALEDANPVRESFIFHKPTMPKPPAYPKSPRYLVPSLDISAALVQTNTPHSSAALSAPATAHINKTGTWTSISEVGTTLLRPESSRPNSARPSSARPDTRKSSGSETYRCGISRPLSGASQVPDLSSRQRPQTARISFRFEEARDWGSRNSASRGEFIIPGTWGSRAVESREESKADNLIHEMNETRGKMERMAVELDEAKKRMEEMNHQLVENDRASSRGNPQPPPSSKQRPQTARALGTWKLDEDQKENSVGALMSSSVAPIRGKTGFKV